MAHLIPPDFPQGTSPGEVLLFESLREEAVGAGWTVLHSLHLPNHVRQVEGEADFVVLMPGRGVLCIEVKSHLTADYVDGAWHLGAHASPDYRGPFRQAELAARSVKQKVVSAFPSTSSILFWSCVVFTHCIPAVTSSAGDWHRWQLLTAADLERASIDVLLEEVMRRAREHVGQAPQARWFDPDSPRPTPTDCDHIKSILRPDVHFLPATSSIRTRRAEEIRRFTEEQLAVIEGLDGVNDRALIEGPAGTGKTALAFEEARRVAATETRAALLCFNQQLAADLRRQASQFGLNRVDISTLHALLLRVARVSPPTHADSEYWSRQLPDLALEALMESGPPYTMLIVDEAQDFTTPAYLDVMDALVEGELARGSWRMFGDFERQAIYSDEPARCIERILERAAGIARFRLRRNCRNTPRVAEYIVRLGGLSPAYSKVLRPDGGPACTPRTAFYRSAEHQQALLSDTLRDLQATGELDTGDIVILSPFADSCAARLAGEEDHPPLEKLPQFRSGATSYGTVAAFKGLEAPAVILTDIDEIATPQAQRLFYVGVSRATDHLRVLVRDGLQGAFARLVSGGSP
jgi:hypothetical protein